MDGVVGVECRAPSQARLASQLGDIWGTRKKQNGNAGKLLTDARETSYLI